MNNKQAELNQAACAHITVKRIHTEVNGRVVEEQWRCAECGTKFYTIPEIFPGQIQTMEPMPTFLDQVAMAMLQAYVTCDHSGTTFWSTTPHMEDAANNALAWAKVYMEARKQ